MNPTQPQDPIQAAMERRGMAPVAPPPAPSSAPAPQAPPTGQPPDSQAPSAPQAPKWQPQNQEDHIVAALTEQLKNVNALKKEQLKMSQQPQPSMGAPVIAQTNQGQAQPPMGGGGSCPVCKGSGCMACGGSGGMGGGGDLFPTPQITSPTRFDMGNASMAKNQQQNPSFF